MISKVVELANKSTPTSAEAVKAVVEVSKRSFDIVGLWGSTQVITAVLRSGSVWLVVKWTM